MPATACTTCAGTLTGSLSGASLATRPRARQAVASAAQQQPSERPARNGSARRRLRVAPAVAASDAQTSLNGRGPFTADDFNAEIMPGAGSLRRSEEAAAAVASAAASSSQMGNLDAAQLDAAIAAALRRVAVSMAETGSSDSSPASTSGSQSAATAQLDEVQLHRVIEEEVHAAFEQELQTLNEAVHTAFEAEMSTAKQTVKQAMDEALVEGRKGAQLTANVNSLMALMGAIFYWRGMGGLLDVLLEDSLEGYIACTVLGFGIILIIRKLKLPVVEGNTLPF